MLCYLKGELDLCSVHARQYSGLMGYSSDLIDNIVHALALQLGNVSKALWNEKSTLYWEAFCSIQFDHLVRVPSKRFEISRYESRETS